MKTSQLFWGFFFITFGSLYLVGRYTTFLIDWYAIWELWPVIIILAGIAIIVKGTFLKPIVSVLFGILLGFLVFGFFNDLFDVFEDRDFHRWHLKDYSENYYNLDYDQNVKHVNLNIDAGAGKFTIEKTTDNLIKGYSEGNVGNYNFTNNIKDSIAWIDIEMQKIGTNIFGGSFKNNFNVSLNENPSYSLDLNIGAAKSYFNLIPFKVNNLVINTGATDTKIKLGNKTELTYLNIEMGAASLKIYIPRSSGCKINGDMVLISKDLDDFQKIKSDYFITDNYDSATEKIIIDIDGGLASFDVERY
ncbi:MAG: hypothetical protein H6610_04725 [Ignavibacteriales bacterium]|nr:hypothetical protein [Ignavibacteriales bacterium]MCB9218748.1 hypothetical protein [Ignavibacteriales bacterium]MCB9259248.1 hypothetical protein [Ignavibacteriales bacterium]